MTFKGLNARSYALSSHSFCAKSAALSNKLKIVRKEIATQDAANRSAYMRKITLGCYWEASQQPAINLIVLNAHHY